MTTSTVPTSTMMELASGNYFDFSDMENSVITLEDVAQGLANTCRFSGHSSRFYSVAEHAVGVRLNLEYLGYSLEIQLAGLHHDDSEAFITDVPRPVKILLPDYMRLEQDVMATVLDKLGLDWLDVHDPAVKQADEWMLAQEAGELLPSHGEPWSVGWDRQYRGLGWGPDKASRVWLAHHREIMRMLNAC